MLVIMVFPSWARLVLPSKLSRVLVIYSIAVLGPVGVAIKTKQRRTCIVTNLALNLS
jgi:hypothetical protein